MTNNDKIPSDLEFDQALSWFVGVHDGPESEMWQRFDAITSYAKTYKKLYWDLLSSWSEIKVNYGALQERFDQEPDVEALKRMLRCLLSEEDTTENMEIQDNFINKTVDAVFDRYHLILRSKK